MYKKIIVNDPVTYQGETLNGCYIVTNNVSIDNITDFIAHYHISIYKSKSIYENKGYEIYVDEIENMFPKSFDANFISGDLYEIAVEIKLYLENKGFKNITIE